MLSRRPVPDRISPVIILNLLVTGAQTSSSARVTSDHRKKTGAPVAGARFAGPVHSL